MGSNTITESQTQDSGSKPARRLPTGDLRMWEGEHLRKALEQDVSEPDGVSLPGKMESPHPAGPPISTYSHSRALKQPPLYTFNSEHQNSQWKHSTQNMHTEQIRVAPEQNNALNILQANSQHGAN